MASAAASITPTTAVMPGAYNNFAPTPAYKDLTCTYIVLISLALVLTAAMRSYIWRMRTKRHTYDKEDNQNFNDAAGFGALGKSEASKGHDDERPSPRSRNDGNGKHFYGKQSKSGCDAVARVNLGASPRQARGRLNSQTWSAEEKANGTNAADFGSLGRSGALCTYTASRDKHCKSGCDAVARVNLGASPIRRVGG